MGVREGNSSFLMCYLLMLQTLSGLSQHKKPSRIYVYVWVKVLEFQLKGKRKMSESKSPGRLKTLPNYIYKILMFKIICKSKPK